MAEKRDYYDVLGVEKSADDAALKKAFRQLAKKYHPDMNPGDKDAEQKFKEVQEAYAVLSDADKRRQYDQFGHAAFEGGAGGAGGFDFSGMDMGDIFSDLFGDFFGGGRRSADTNGPRRGANLRASVRVTFEEAVFGCEKELEIVLKDECANCHGTGAKPGTSPETCSKCGGRGKVMYTQQSLFGTVQNVQTCPECNGSGKVVKEKCTSCRGSGYIASKKRIKVTIPAGIDDGQSVRIRDKGEPGRNGGPRGDLLVEVVVSRNQCVQASDFPEAGYEYLFHCADFVCAGGAWRRSAHQYGRRRRIIRSKTRNADRYQDTAEGERSPVAAQQIRTRGSLRDACRTGSDRVKRSGKRRPAQI